MSDASNFKGKGISSVHKYFGEEAWDALWRWKWLTRETWEKRYWKEKERATRAPIKLLHELGVHSVLDCSCGLGYSTVVLAEAGFDVEGSDASAMAIKYAPAIASERGLKIRFFRSRFSELGKMSGRMYDCAYSDYIDEIATAIGMVDSARGILAVLKGGGWLVFESRPPRVKADGLGVEIEKEWLKRKHIEIDPPYKSGSTWLTRKVILKKTREGILEQDTFVAAEQGEKRTEVVTLLNPSIRWTYDDYKGALLRAGLGNIRYDRGKLILARKVTFANH
jgi:SAM-dependent methyltransferase